MSAEGTQQRAVQESDIRFSCLASSLANVLSREAAKQRSPERKPWVRNGHEIQPCKGDAGSKVFPNVHYCGFQKICFALSGLTVYLIL